MLQYVCISDMTESKHKRQDHINNDPPLTRPQ